jgi:hypothetical protein
MPSAISPQDVVARLTEYWSPRVIGEVDDNYVKVAKLLGVFGWHAHDGEDELFFVLRGRLRIEMEAGAVEIAAGEFYVAEGRAPQPGGRGRGARAAVRAQEHAAFRQRNQRENPHDPRTAAQRLNRRAIITGRASFGAPSGESREQGRIQNHPVAL